nr:PrgI family protein [Clostridia bacterium]
MANFVSVPRDLTRVKDKIIFGLTKRQVICFSLAALVGVPLFFVVKKLTENISASTLSMMAVMM